MAYIYCPISRSDCNPDCVFIENDNPSSDCCALYNAVNAMASINSKLDDISTSIENINE